MLPRSTASFWVAMYIPILWPRLHYSFSMGSIAQTPRDWARLMRVSGGTLLSQRRNYHIQRATACLQGPSNYYSIFSGLLCHCTYPRSFVFQTYASPVLLCVPQILWCLRALYRTIPSSKNIFCSTSSPIWPLLFFRPVLKYRIFQRPFTDLGRRG